ncbi:MAG: hypothetical protein COA40_03235 [Aequorivita sp.]|nr:MAG: hypothetical protein COA40_03235 [Aequorivita sp.]
MKIKLFTIVCSIFFISTYAQIDFEEKIVIDNRNATNSPTSVFAADIDGDGNIDMLSASAFDNKIAWYRNLDGQGGYGNQQVISTEAMSASAVFAADIDGDGDIDVLSASYYDNKIAWYENLDGQGTFSNQIVISTEAIGARAIFAEDIDGDGDIDVVSGSGDPTEGKVAWYENVDGIGNFGLEHIVNDSVITIDAVSVADIDGDGDMDVLSGGSFNSPLGWYENLNSQGQFGPLRTIANSGIDNSVYAVDINNDGDLDVVSSSGDKFSWYQNIDGQGNFGPGQIIIDYVSSLYANFPADIDGDGDIDVVSGYYSDSNPAIVWNENLDGAGNFGPPQDVNTDSLIIASLYCADVDNDGDFDILFASEDRIGVHENIDGAGNYGPQQFFTINVDSPRYIDIADIDGDGYLDVLSASYNDGEIAWYKKGVGNGDYGIQRTISKKNYAAFCVQGVDMDGDGDIDALFSTDFLVAWQENLDGNGNFGPKNIIFEDITGPSVREVNAADIDGDGDLDIMYASFMAMELIWQENLDGEGTFGQPNIIYNAFGFAPISIDMADINNDGDIDILCSSLGVFGEDGATWFENLGGGVFGSPELISLDTYYIEGADIDGDNDIDVIATNRLDETIMWFENMDGQGSFGPEKIIASEIFTPLTAYSTDIDNDGDLDIITASYYDQKISWFENLDGAGNFGSQNIIKNDADRANFIYADDADADGDIDVFATLEGTNEILWFKNTLILGVNETVTLNFYIFPNPTSNSLSIISEKTIKQIEVYNNLGQLVTGNIVVLNDENFEINVSKLVTGVYFLKIKTTDGEIGVERFIKE